jgi:DNA-directed RNA polymerase specialized sigma24 family protein
MGREANPIIFGFKEQRPKALGALYDDCGGTLYGLIFSIVGDGVASEAILELTFSQIWTRSYKRVQNDSELRKLAFRLGCKKAFDYQRAGASVEADNQDVPGNSNAMQAAISQLSAEDRALLHSIYVDRNTLS